MSRQRPAWCSVSTPVMWSSTTITSSTCGRHCWAKMPTVAEPQPTRMRSSSRPSTMGALPACTTTAWPPSMVSSTASPAHSFKSVSQVTLPSFLLPPVRCRTPPMREHLRAVLGRRHVADHLAAGADRRLLRPQMAVGVDLHLDAAVAEDALGHDGDGVDAGVLARHDEGCGLVVGIGGAGADAGDERALRGEDAAVPVLRLAGEGHQRRAVLGRALHEHDGSVRTSVPSDVGVAVAGAGAAGADAAQHRTGIAAHDALVALGRAELAGALQLGAGVGIVGHGPSLADLEAAGKGGRCASGGPAPASPLAGHPPDHPSFIPKGRGVRGVSPRAG